MRTLLLDIHEEVKKQGGALPMSQPKFIARATARSSRHPTLYARNPLSPQVKKDESNAARPANFLNVSFNSKPETLGFMTDPDVPFTNNQGENDIRMTKVHQKISGGFRSQDGADIFYRVRSYISTCAKNNVPASEALSLLFIGNLPDLLNDLAAGFAFV